MTPHAVTASFVSMVRSHGTLRHYGTYVIIARHVAVAHDVTVATYVLMTPNSNKSLSLSRDF